MLLEKIKNKLEELDEFVYYGAVDTEVNEELWNYIVFNRVKLQSNVSKNAFSDYFDVHIVRENFIPEGLDEQVISRMLTINGVRLASESSEFDYVRKSKTNSVVEMLTLHFVRARK